MRRRACVRRDARCTSSASDDRRVGNEDRQPASFGGRRRWRGVRPTVRGVHEPGRSPARLVAKGHLRWPASGHALRADQLQETRTNKRTDDPPPPIVRRRGK